MQIPVAKSQSYIAIFEDALDQLAVLGDIAPDIVKGDSKPLGEDITRILKDQKALESRFQELVVDQERLKSLPNKTKFKENQLAIMDVTNELQQSTQFLAKNLKSHPSVAQNLMKIHAERSNLLALISKTLRELKEFKFESLITTVEEDKKKRNTLQNTINREIEASELQKELQRELANERKLLEEEMNDRNQVIQQLKDTIQEINGLTNSEQKYIKKETKAHENSVKQRCQYRESQLIEQKNLELKRLQLENVAHNQIVDFLTRQRETLESQIQDWMTKYEEDTEAKSNELEAMKQKRSQDLDRFEELVSAYEELEKIVEEDRQIKLREAEERRILQARTEAATTIQRWWRRHMLNKEKANNAKSAKKGGKEKGGKKKKK